MAAAKIALVAFWGASAIAPLPDSAARVLRDARDGGVRRGAFSIVSQNILAPVYARMGSYNVPAEVLAWPRRCAQLCEQLEAYDADVVMLQEVEPASFAPDFERLLETCGYEAVLQAEDPKRPYANAVLFRRGRFEVVSAESRSRAQIVVLLERAEPVGAMEAGEPTGGGDQRARAGNLLYLANVHLQKGSQSQVTRAVRTVSMSRGTSVEMETNEPGGQVGSRLLSRMPRTRTDVPSPAASTGRGSQSKTNPGDTLAMDFVHPGPQFSGVSGNWNHRQVVERTSASKSCTLEQPHVTVCWVV